MKHYVLVEIDSKTHNTLAVGLTEEEAEKVVKIVVYKKR